MEKNIWVAELYFDSKYFQDEANKTIGASLAVTETNEETIEGFTILGEQSFSKNVFENRRNVTSRLNLEGEELMNRVKDFFKRNNLDVTFKWDIHCGCRMCPCSPGFRVITKKDSSFKSKDDYRMTIWVTDGDLSFRKPKFNMFDLPEVN